MQNLKYIKAIVDAESKSKKNLMRNNYFNKKNAK